MWKQFQLYSAWTYARDVVTGEGIGHNCCTARILTIYVKDATLVHLYQSAQG